MPFEKNLLCVKYIYTWKHLERLQRRACPRQQKAAVCRILIGLSVRLMLVFDVFQGSMPRPNPGEKDGEKHKERPDCWDSELRCLYVLLADWKSVYILFLEMVSLFCPSAWDTLTSIVFACCEMKGHFSPPFLKTSLYKTVVQSLTAG